MSAAVIVGAGPNGLAAAVALAKEGVDVTVLEAADKVGGGVRSTDLTLPGLIHDVCSAIHPMAIGSPFLNGLDLERYGLRWLWPQLVFGPRPTVHPYRLGVPGMYICSAATPPGPGAHGMCGANAAAEALTFLRPEIGLPPAERGVPDVVLDVDLLDDVPSGSHGARVLRQRKDL